MKILCRAWMYLLIAFATSAAAASISPETVAATLARERGIEVAPSSVRLSVTEGECRAMHIANVRRGGQHLDVILKCDGRRLPFVARVTAEVPIGHRTSVRSEVASLGVVVPVVVRRGAIVRLLMNGHNARITLPAVSLDAGGPGETVRVRIPGSNKIRIARVMRSATVEEVAP